MSDTGCASLQRIGGCEGGPPFDGSATLPCHNRPKAPLVSSIVGTSTLLRGASQVSSKYLSHHAHAMLQLPHMNARPSLRAMILPAAVLCRYSFRLPRCFLPVAPALVPAKLLQSWSSYSIFLRCSHQTVCLALHSSTRHAIRTMTEACGLTQ